MNIPGFTAHASLYRANNRYRPSAGEQQGSVVIPQLPTREVEGGPVFKGSGGCINDCMDKVEFSRPTLTDRERAMAIQQCTEQCKDPLQGVDLSTPSNGLNGFLSDVGIGFWELGCSRLVNPFLCREVANVIRGQS